MKSDLSKITCIEDLRLVAKRKCRVCFMIILTQALGRKPLIVKILRILKTSVSVKSIG